MKIVYLTVGVLILALAFENTRKAGAVLLGLIVLGALIVATRDGGALSK